MSECDYHVCGFSPVMTIYISCSVYCKQHLVLYSCSILLIVIQHNLEQLNVATFKFKIK